MERTRGIKAPETISLAEPEPVVVAGYPFIENIDASPPDVGDYTPAELARARQD
jgi:hypothetical protein